MKVQALRVNQWLKVWDDVKYDASKKRKKPEGHFFLLSMNAKDLRLLSGIYPRNAKGRAKASDDLGIQRRHEPERSKEINEFVRFGHPWSDLSNSQRASGDYADLKKPGWLPTAIVINILKANETRRGKQISAADTIKVTSTAEASNIELPKGFEKKQWASSSIPPIEVIDGQHRLWAFDETIPEGDYELPVVAFHGLDISWQAYLFYTINIKPKRINASLAFDLYPLLRTEDWLEKFEGPVIYRETRAQEIVDALYSFPKSPWHLKINMLGESGHGQRMVSQAAWIRSLLATLIKSWDGKKGSIGGLFGTPVGTNEHVLGWSRHEQSAFIISAGEFFHEAIKASQSEWCASLRALESNELFKNADPAFYGSNTLIAQDQGIRVFLGVVNDLCYLNSDLLKLEGWGQSTKTGGDDLDLICEAVKSLKKTEIATFLKLLCKELASFDWRASSAPNLTREQSLIKSAFRGSGGYKVLRQELLNHLSKSSKKPLSQLAQQAMRQLGYL